MSGDTAIEWTDATWNPTTGCDKVSPGCDHCYALTQAKRLKAMHSPAYQGDGNPATSGPGFLAHEWPPALEWPIRKTKPLRIFVNSMSDLFHDNISDRFIASVFAVMASCPQHTFQILTKRHARMRALLNSETFQALYAYQLGLLYGDRSRRNLTRHLAQPSVWPLANVWLGVSVENQQWADIRIPALLDTAAAVRFLSMEPLLGPVDLFNGVFTEDDGHLPGPAVVSTGYSMRTDYGTGTEHSVDHEPGVDWVIVGGESGPGARRMHVDWARALRDQCVAAGVPFLFKQWGEWAPYNQMTQAGQEFVERSVETCIGPEDAHYVFDVGKHRAGRELDGRTWDEYPADR